MANLSISQLATAEQQSISDLFEVAIPDSGSATGYASRKVSMATIADYIANDVQLTGLTTEAQNIIDAINEVNAENGTKVSWSEQSELGAKNLIPYPYSDSYRPSKLFRGITFTELADKTVSLSGTSTGVASWFITDVNYDSAVALGENEYTVSLECANPNVSMRVGRFSATAQETIEILTDVYPGQAYNLTTSNGYRYTFVLQIRATGVEVTNVIAKPMLRMADDTDGVYTAPAKTNIQLTQSKADIAMLGTDESGNSIASKAYAQGEFFVRNGKMYKAKVAIAQGASFTVGTNCEETTIFAELKALAQP